MNSCGGTKNTGLGVGFGEQTLTYFLTCRNKWLLEIVYENAPPVPSEALMDCSAKWEAGQEGTALHMPLNSFPP